MTDRREPIQEYLNTLHNAPAKLPWVLRASDDILDITDRLGRATHANLIEFTVAMMNCTQHYYDLAKAKSDD